MKHSTRATLKGVVRTIAAAAAIAAATAGHAASTTLTAPDFTGSLVTDPSYSETVATFDFSAIPVGSITSFTISGEWGSQAQVDAGYYAGSANSTLYANGLAIATCRGSDICYTNDVPVAWSFTLDPSQYAALDGHIDLVAAVGTDGYYFGVNTLSGMQVSISAVPEPTSAALMLAAVGGCAIAARRRRRHSAPAA